MAYKLSDFNPMLSVKTPSIEVSLPADTYVFELVVIDSAGNPSLPDRVEIIVKYEAPDLPTVTKMTPRFGLQGTAVEITMEGTNLRHTKEIAFLRKLGKSNAPSDDAIDDEIKVTQIKEYPNGASITFSAAIDKDAKVGLRPFRLITKGGDTNSGTVDRKLRLLVVGKPTITAVLSAGPNPNETDEFQVIGENLFLEGEPITEHHVEFVLKGAPVTTIKAEVQNGSQPHTLKVLATIDKDAEKGKYALRVTTPAGHTTISAPTYEVK